jgi:hypothetical protein
LAGQHALAPGQRVEGWDRPECRAATHRVSSGKAAETCGMSRVEFLLAAGRLGVSLVQLDADELKRELGDG